jgi:hypothetical protein
MVKSYYVSYGFYLNSVYNLNSVDIKVYVEDGLSQGELAKLLERQLMSVYDDQTIVIINFWEM